MRMMARRRRSQTGSIASLKARLKKILVLWSALENEVSLKTVRVIRNTLLRFGAKTGAFRSLWARSRSTTRA